MGEYVLPANTTLSVGNNSVTVPQDLDYNSEKPLNYSKLIAGMCGTDFLKSVLRLMKSGDKVKGDLEQKIREHIQVQARAYETVENNINITNNISYKYESGFQQKK